MTYVKRFLEKKSEEYVSEREFGTLFHKGMNKNIYLLKSKKALPVQPPPDKHAHDHFEFTVPLSHSPRLSIDSKTFELPCKTLFPSNPGQIHGVSERLPPQHLIAFQLDRQYLQTTALAAFGKHSIEFENTYVPFDRQLETMLELFLIESKQLQAGCDFILENLSNMITIHLLRTLDSNLEYLEMQPGRPPKKEIAKAIDFLHEQIDNDFSLENVSAVAEMSKYHFIRIFKQETGKTPYQYFIDIKMKKASELIKTGKYTITEVCFMCGFKSHSHFTRIFCQKMGITPSTLQKSVNKNCRGSISG